MAETQLRCPVCSAGARVLARPEPWTFARCSTCGTFFVDPMPRGDAVAGADEHYTTAYYAGDARADEAAWEEATQETSTARVRAVERALGRKGTWLDVGCGTGYLLATARTAGWHVTGIEVSARAATFARDAHGIEVIEGTLAGAHLPPGSFDVVSMVHVLEHLPDPMSALADVRNVLTRDGLFALALPNARALLYAAYNAYHFIRGRYRRTRYSCSLYPPSHLYAWDEAAIRRLLARAGFEVVELTITGKGDRRRYPVVSWGRGGVAQITRATETLGRMLGRGSLIEVLARPAGEAAQPR